MKNSYCSFSTFSILVCSLFFLGCKKENSKSKPTIVSDDVMNKVYEEIKTPYKNGLVLVPENSSKMVDSPSVFKVGDKWYMTYIVFDGKGMKLFWLQVTTCWIG